ncbi:Sorbose reductase sou2 [Yamadazyma tenuis]|uniref:NAD(P)-binding protein n=1 Tax=Candida tenuis (strain ATCC 10573 / BCRC 21748 / CBS 615 / JCM 9827 / NBRC 10315 / NRRL Y-1498 / VKM Y-70) TaxID=590646 RepID=G3AZW8_CANTC|nr:NAD(P)-binding protein [Yamadazyma tenuis ATCC 10573]EGV65260.1 NAD(P)-binding protein [Yamadazyma tenuis ATCC 10573]WEJ95086.1 Sorbose reductase sou2 [Yamadazyma tenuis]
MTIDTQAEAQSMINTAVGPVPVPFPTISNNIIDLFMLTGKSAIVTGGARGIGYAISEGYCQANIAKLAIVDYSNHEENIAKLQKTHPNTQVEFFQCDVRNAEQVKDVITRIHELFGVLDIFVANAGIAWTSGAMIESETDAEWHNVMNVDVNGVYYCAKNIGKIFKQQGKGSLIFTASMSAHIVNVPNYQAPYNAAKAAVLHLSRSLSIEWIDFARVNTVSPGYMATEISEFIPKETRTHWSQLVPKGREGIPRELAGAYLYLASDAASYTTGADIRVDGAYTVP